MPKPDKVLRFRPLVEVQAAVARLKKVVLFHPKPIVVQEPAKMCVCAESPPRKGGKKSTAMTQCDACYEWFHNDCAGIADDRDLRGDEWKCEWCLDPADREDFQR